VIRKTALRRRPRLRRSPAAGEPPALPADHRRAQLRAATTRRPFGAGPITAAVVAG